MNPKPEPCTLHPAPPRTVEEWLNHPDRAKECEAIVIRLDEDFYNAMKRLTQTNNEQEGQTKETET